MTQQEALQEAQKRWGKRASVWQNDDTFYVADRIPGDYAGLGSSWEAAFADADERLKAGQQ